MDGWNTILSYLGCDIGGAKELGVIYFPTNWGAKEPQNLPNHRVAIGEAYFQVRLLLVSGSVISHVGSLEHPKLRSTYTP